MTEVLSEKQRSENTSERLERLLLVVWEMACRLRFNDEDMLSVGKVRLCELLSPGGEEDDRYILTAVRNAMIDYLRYEKVRQREQLLSEVLGTDWEPVGRPNDGVEQVEIAELLARLSTRMRRAFRLHCLCGYTLQETAQAMGLSVRSVSILTVKAKRRLRRELE